MELLRQHHPIKRDFVDVDPPKVLEIFGPGERYVRQRACVLGVVDTSKGDLTVHLAYVLYLPNSAVREVLQSVLR